MEAEKSQAGNLGEPMCSSRPGPKAYKPGESMVEVLVQKPSRLEVQEEVMFQSKSKGQKRPTSQLSNKAGEEFPLT